MPKYRMRIALLGVLAIVSLSLTLAADAGLLRATMNGLDIGIDERTGSVVYLSHPATGVILLAEPAGAGLLDLAYPTEAYEPQRLASRYSSARVERRGNEVSIVWEALGASRPKFALPAGKVSAKVVLRPADDGRSVILNCRVENQSAAPVPQVLFPDLQGLRAFAGEEHTQLRFSETSIPVFQKPSWSVDAPFYADLRGWKQYAPSPYAYWSHNSLRWLDLGGLTGGISVFHRKWATNDRPTVMTFRSESEPSKLRLAWQHKKTIAPGQSWESGEFWLTPHRGGWAKGIEPFRQYVREANPPRQLPRHVRDGIGFRTIWMIQEPERDPERADFHFSDLPRIARESREHGLEEIVPWFWCNAFRIPIPVRSELGSWDDFVEGVRQARKLGVNVAPFVSLHIQLDGDRYGTKTGRDSWTYHPELIPLRGAYYVHGQNGFWIPDTNETWQGDIRGALTDLINRGVPSISWDQLTYEMRDTGRPALFSLIESIRALARAKDPESTFSGETNTNLELDNAVLDYTWNWNNSYPDAAPLMNVLRSPRLNYNVESSPLAVKQAFADGLYLNVMPRKVDGPNGTAMIADRPALSAALKQVAALRKQFLPFFVDGVTLGNSVLSAPAEGFVRAHQLADRLLLIVVNDSDKGRPLALESDLDVWLPARKIYEIRTYDQSGKLMRTTGTAGPHWSARTEVLPPGQLTLFEVRVQ